MQTRREHLKALGAVFAGAAAPDFSAYSDAEKEKFLLTSRIVSVAEIGHGVTKPVKAELELNGISHAAKLQVVDKELSDFFAADGTRVPMKDSWHYNVAAYKLDRLLHLKMVTVEVARPYKAKPASFSWWVDDVMFEEVERIRRDIAPPDKEAFDRQRANSRVFDELIINIDRNLSNLLITNNWSLALIDHSRAFTAYQGIRNKENLKRCGRGLFDAMKTLTPASVAQAVGPHLSARERAALLARRDRIVEFFQHLATEKGEQNVLFA
jgi:hypothetical protein